MKADDKQFEENLKMLWNLFPGRAAVTTEEAMQILGYKSKKSVYNNYPVKNGRISIVALASSLCG